MLKESGADDGTCGPVKKDTNPFGDNCPADAASTCDKSGQCDGTGLCAQFYKAGTSCGTSVCVAATNSATGQLCDGSGNCSASASGIACNLYKCANGGCPSECNADAECTSNAYCKLKICLMRMNDGAVCTAGNECLSNNCVDGVCCNSACLGQCEACDVSGAAGTCAPVSGAPHGNRTVCAAGDAENPCAKAACDGAERTSCQSFEGSQTTCGKATCAGGNAVATGVCDSKGKCKTPDPVPCGAYGCSDTACKTTCANDGDCSAGNTCDKTTSKCVSGATCDGDHTTTSANGETTNCTPYKCQSDGTCRISCGSVQDCATPFVCSPENTCVALAAESEDSGCSVTAIPPRRGGGAAVSFSIAMLLAIGAVARRARRAQRAG